MAFLEKFAPDERELLVSLPYRAGLWISVSDQTGGIHADDKEANALGEIIREKASGMFESAFVHEVMADVCDRRSGWNSWTNDLDKVPDECGRVVELISKKLSSRDLDSYRHNIMAIAIEVARAFREFDKNTPLFSRLWTKLRIWLDKVVGVTKGVTYESEDLLNVSFEEDLALAKLSDALKAGISDPISDAEAVKGPQ